MMLPFVISGCGKSGTLYTARLLNTLGIRTSFEEFFTAFTLPTNVNAFTCWLKATSTCGEVSSFAAPFSQTLPTSWRPAPGAVVHIHQIRNPIKVIRSLMGARTFHPRPCRVLNVRFNFRHVPEMSEDDEPIILAMTYWIYWNRLAKSRHPHLYHVESISKGSLQSLLETLGYKRSPIECGRALAKYGTNYHGGARDETVAWDSLPGGSLKDLLMSEALSYAYTEEEIVTA
jgi:hypothetical protein